MKIYRTLSLRPCSFFALAILIISGYSAMANSGAIDAKQTSKTDQANPQSKSGIGQPVKLWPAGAPGALGTGDEHEPTLTPYWPDPAKASGAAMVVCPGGAYGGLAPYEGHDYALFLNQHGLTAFVLKYRLGSAGYRHPRMLEDAARAVRLVRSQAAQWHVDPHRVGIMGSSAGGHLAATLMTHFDSGRADAADPIERESSRPDLGVLCYPVITMGELTNLGTQQNLLGEHPSPELIKELSNELQVTPQTPPCFLYHRATDSAVPVENSINFALALRRNKVPFALHVYPEGDHGGGVGDTPPFAHPAMWTAEMLLWLDGRGFLQRK